MESISISVFTEEKLRKMQVQNGFDTLQDLFDHLVEVSDPRHLRGLEHIKDEV